MDDSYIIDWLIHQMDFMVIIASEFVKMMDWFVYTLEQYFIVQITSVKMVVVQFTNVDARQQFSSACHNNNMFFSGVKVTHTFDG